MERERKAGWGSPFATGVRAEVPTAPLTVVLHIDADPVEVGRARIERVSGLGERRSAN